MQDSTGPAVPDTWYQSAFGHDYLHLYRHRDADQARREADFAIEALRLAPPARVLDLGCGSGRHVAPLRAAGFTLVGVDLSRALLAQARTRPLGEQGAWVCADMRVLPFGGACRGEGGSRPGDGGPGRGEGGAVHTAIVPPQAGAASGVAGFDAVLSFFTSFGYFFAETDNRRVLAEIARVLRPGGRFLLDLMDADAVRARLVPHSTREDGGCQVDEWRWLTPDGSRVEKRLVLTAPGAAPRTYHESVRLYARAEAEQALAAAGLQVSACAGDFDGQPHVAGRGPRMILSGRRKEHAG